MNLCLSYRIRSLTLLLGSLSLLPGCIDPKSVGQESDEAGNESGESGGPTTQTQGSGTTQGPGTQTQGSGTETDTSGTETGENCPPIDIADCVECECIEGEWSCSNAGCNYDCAGSACGDSCMMCPDEDPECTGLDAEGICTADGQCVGVPPPKFGFCEGALQPGFEGDLDVEYGCADMVVLARDMADEQALVVSIDQGLVDDAISSGMAVHAEISATDPAVTLEGRSGVSVTLHECNDVIEPGVDIHETWLPNSGMLIVDVVPNGMETADATVQLVDVELSRELPGPNPITVNLTLTDVNVGWLPG